MATQSQGRQHGEEKAAKIRTMKALSVRGRSIDLANILECQSAGEKRGFNSDEITIHLPSVSVSRALPIYTQGAPARRVT